MAEENVAGEHSGDERTRREHAADAPSAEEDGGGAPSAETYAGHEQTVDEHAGEGELQGDAPASRAPPEEAPDGLITVRGALYGIGLLWLAAVATVGAVQAVAYGVMVEPVYGLLGLLAAAIAVMTAGGALRVFGYR